jgi:citrate synthase
MNDATATETGKQTAKLTLPDAEIQLPITIGSEGEKAVDVQKLRSDTGYITLDPGYRNTGSVESAVTFIDGEEGILRYRGYPIEQLARHSTFVETSYLLIYGELPTARQLDTWANKIRSEQRIHEGLRNAFDGFPASAHPMAILSAMINAVSCYHPSIMEMESEATFELAAARLLAKVRTIAAAAYKTSIGERIMYPRPDMTYCANFLHMMFSRPYDEIVPDEDLVKALNVILILHADHEQNCSTSTVRMVGSSGANLFASCAAGVCALWGPLHGGANVAVLNQLQRIHDNPDLTTAKFVEKIKNKEDKLFGFGHAVYKNFDPRAQVLKEHADKVLDKLGMKDPLLDIAKELEETALRDEYFIERKLYPNVDFYSGIIMRAMGIPVNMFTVMFAIGRMPGWIANWKEVQGSSSRIYRPRQVYVGPNERVYTPLDERG